MEDRGWVCVHDYGTDAAEAVDGAFLDVVKAVHEAGVDMQRWLTGWDDKRGTPRMGIWAPRIPAAVIATLTGKVDVQRLTEILHMSKSDPEFIHAVDAAWRLGGREAAMELFLTQYPRIAQAIASSGL